MHDTSDKYLLQIEPKRHKSLVPVDDELTIKMESLLKSAEKGTQRRGVHGCICGERSGSCDLLVHGYITNSLAAHHLRWHRSEIPRSEIIKLQVL